MRVNFSLSSRASVVVKAGRRVGVGVRPATVAEVQRLKDEFPKPTTPSERKKPPALARPGAGLP
jgi:hypothetical protein